MELKLFSDIWCYKIF